jgi:hypothetical protein
MGQVQKPGSNNWMDFRFVLHILRVPNLNPETGCPRRGFDSFRERQQADLGIVLSMRPHTVSSISFPSSLLLANITWRVLRACRSQLHVTFFMPLALNVTWRVRMPLSLFHVTHSSCLSPLMSRDEVFMLVGRSFTWLVLHAFRPQFHVTYSSCFSVLISYDGGFFWPLCR